MPSRASDPSGNAGKRRPALRTILGEAGRPGLAFALLLALYLTLGLFARGSLVRLAAGLGAVTAGVWLVVRLLRWVARGFLWRLRSRLLVTYLFIAVVPIFLFAALAGLTGVWLLRQMAVYLVTSEMERRVDALASITESVVRTDPESRPSVLERTIDLFYRDRYPEIEALLREGGSRQIRYPEGAMPPAPLGGWPNTSGVLMRGGRFYLWSYAKTQTGDITVTVPLTREFLAGLVPKLGFVDIGEASPGEAQTVAQARNVASAGSRPPPRNRFDLGVDWFATLPDSDWTRPGQAGTGAFLAVGSRVSAVLGAVFNRKADVAQGAVLLILFANLVVFGLVEIVSLLIGIGMTRNITGAVHRLYEGTQKAIEGDFSHRIQVKGADQLADLSRSFNRMTENIQRLLAVAKEKERLQAEIEIAREVQNQLFPRTVPELRTLRVKAVWKPARLVSGDYFDYEIVSGNRMAIAIGDVAGKGISAALLMAALQSALRAHLEYVPERVPAMVGNGPSGAEISTSRVVSNLNKQLYSTTSLEKYATFFLGIYDEDSSTFTYTNAGHLPPLLVRDGHAEPLEVNGTVVGAFPFSSYDESRTILRPGDLLAFYTDGITEPENEYGQMFGEERLRDLLIRNAHKSEDEILRLVLDTVRQWTATEELQDDMTLMLVRRV